MFRPSASEKRDKISNWENPDTYLFLLLVEVINNDTNKEIQSEEWAKDNKNYEVKVHVFVPLKSWLFFLLKIFWMREENNYWRKI